MKVRTLSMCFAFLWSSTCFAVDYHAEMRARSYEQNYKDRVLALCVANAYKSDENAPWDASGTASALLELNTDNKFKLNGLIRFTVVDGTITKLGYVQYVLNAAALFRNPFAMISPSTLLDLVNIPEGMFNLIDGELNIRDNIIHRMQIKSASPQLSSYIAGRYNLETRDTSLRIYTKFSSRNKGFAGFLRNISLNSLARKIDAGDRNTANYYASEIARLPEIDAREEECQIFLTKVEGDVENNNFISSLKKIK